MRYLLDSNAIVMLTTNASVPLVARAARCDEGDLVTSAIALAEVFYGSTNNKPPPLEELEAFFEEVAVLEFGREAAFAYARLPFRRGSYDRLIAAHAMSLGLTVVTDNLTHFADVPGLRVENWTV